MASEVFEHLVLDEDRKLTLPDHIGLYDINKYLRVNWSEIEDPEGCKRDVLGPRFVFAFVRHPHSRFLSAYMNQVARTWKPDRRQRSDLARLPTEEILEFLGRPNESINSTVTFEEFLRFVEALPETKRNSHWDDQTRMLRSGKLPYDSIGRYERFEKDLRYVYDQVSLPSALLDQILKKNTSDRSKTSTILDDPDVIRRLNKIYEEDLDFFYSDMR